MGPDVVEEPNQDMVGYVRVIRVNMHALPAQLEMCIDGEARRDGLPGSPTPRGPLSPRVVASCRFLSSDSNAFGQVERTTKSLERGGEADDVVRSKRDGGCSSSRRAESVQSHRMGMRSTNALERALALQPNSPIKCRVKRRRQSLASSRWTRSHSLSVRWAADKTIEGAIIYKGAHRLPAPPQRCPSPAQIDRSCSSRSSSLSDCSPSRATTKTQSRSMHQVPNHQNLHRRQPSSIKWEKGGAL